MRHYYISQPPKVLVRIKTCPHQIRQLTFHRPELLKSKQKQTPFQNNLRNLLLIFSVYSSISGNIVESSPLCILVGISCLQKDSPKAIRGLKHLQSFQNHIFSLNVTRCWAARYVLCFTSHNLFTFLHPIVAYMAADNCIPGKKAQ